MKFITISLIFVLTISCTNRNPKENIKNDNLSQYKEYHENGNLKIEVELVNGLQNGTLKEYYEDGTTKYTQDWEMGIALGDFKAFDTQGKLTYHENSSYLDDSPNIIGYQVVFMDTTKEYSTYDRIVIKNMKEFKNSVILSPASKVLKYGIENKVSIKIPNISYLNINVENAYICLKYHNYYIEPKYKDKNVIVNISAKINDSTFYFNPIKFVVKE